MKRLPGDAEILDMIRHGLNTISAIGHKIYGYPPEMEWIRARNIVRERLCNLEKYGFVRKTERFVQIGYGRNMARIWEVIE